KFQFNRLIKMMDKIVVSLPKETKVFAQIGSSDYVPKNFKSKSFLTHNEIGSYFNQTDLVVTHGGTGSVISALKLKKKVIIVPRDKNYGEHVDNHQYQIAEVFKKKNYCDTATNYEELFESI